MARNSTWANPETLAAFRDALTECPETEEVAAEWLAAYGARARRPYARQLRRDFFAWYGCPSSDEFSETLICLGLKRVHWEQVAHRLLERVQPDERSNRHVSDS